MLVTAKRMRTVTHSMGKIPRNGEMAVIVVSVLTPVTVVCALDRVVRTNFFFINLLQVDKLGTNKYKLSEDSDFALGLNPGGGNPILYFTQFTEVPGS